MKHTILELYAYLVCFVSLSCGAIFLQVGVYSLVEISAPGFMLSDEQVQKHRDNETFATSHYKSDIYEILTDEQIAADRVESLVIAIGEERKSAGKRLIGAVIVIFINIVVFFVHWRVGRKATKEVLAA